MRGTAVNGGFELVDAAGTRYRLGTSDASRLESGTMVAAWYLERVTDVAGHVIDYSYERQNGELYLTGISWGGSGVYRAELVYEDRSDVVVSCWRTSFRIAAGRRLHAVKLWSFGAVRHTLQLGYDQTFALSRLASVQLIGSDGTASPATTFSYATPTAGQAQVLANTGGWSLGNNVSFFDVDKDGAMDLIRVEAGNHRYRRNQGGSFGPEVAIGNAPALNMTSVRMLDLDGDSGAEMVTRSGSAWRSYRIVNGAWSATDWPGSSTLDLQTVAVADLNGDNRMDVVTASGSGISVWFGTANGFGPAHALPAISANEASVTPTTVQFPDINGDGLADAVAVNSNGLLEYRGRGDGTFERIGAISYPWTGTTDTTQIRLADLDRDGLLDIVRVGTSQVFWYRGKPDGTFSPTATILNRPAGADSTTVVALADANGNGSTDVVWSSTSGMWALDLAGATNAGLLVGIDNGLGKSQQFGYTASAQLAWAAEAAGAAWTERMPVSIAVTVTAIQHLATGEPDRTSLLAVRDGIYEASERRFIGFTQSTDTFPGAGAGDTIRVIRQFHPGHGADRALRGQMLSERTEDGAGNVFKLVENQVSALPIAGLPDAPRLKRAAVTQTQTTYTELGETPAVVRTRFMYDAEGRETEEHRDGRVTPGMALDGDETVVTRSYTAEDPVTGVRDLVCDEQVLDGALNVVSHTQRLFGDDSSVAGTCQPGKGWPREDLAYLAEESRWVSVKRTQYDAHGNAIDVYEGGVERVLGYDALGLHPVSEQISPATGQTLTYLAQWDNVAGVVTRVSDPSGTSVQAGYDGLNRIISLGANDAPAHMYYRYHWVGPRPWTETFTFDGDPSAIPELPATWTAGAGWRHTVAVSNGASESVLTATQLDTDQWTIHEVRQRDQRGRVIARYKAFAYIGTDPMGAAVPSGPASETLSYDALDRVVDRVLVTGSHKRATYHPLGVTLTEDGLSPVDTVLDGQDRTVVTTRSIGGVTEKVEASYDAAGRVSQFSVQGGQLHHDFIYDTLGRLTYAVDPDSGARSMTYDDGGRLIGQVNGAGDTVTFGYDGAGRLLSVDGAGVATRYHYDAARTPGFDHLAGRLAWIEDAAGTVDLGYDAMGRPMTQQRTVIDRGTTVVGRETTQLSPSGLVLSADLGDGVVLPIHYDAAGRAIQIGDVWSAQAYSASDVAVHEQFGNGVVQQLELDALDRASRISVSHGATTLYDVAASYNAFGALATLTDSDHAGADHAASYSFDDAGRLTAATIGSGATEHQFSYAYDALQNLTRRTATPTQLGFLAGHYHYRSGAPRQLENIVDDGGSVVATFAYDGAGRQTLHAGNRLGYDALSHLTSVTNASGGTVEHRYGYDGSRVMTRNTAGTTTYWITPNVVVRGAERDHYVRLGDRTLAKITTSSAAAPIAAAIVTHGRIGLAGLVLLAMFALAALAASGLRRSSAIRGLRAALATSLALLTATAGCTASTSVATERAAATVAGRLYFHQGYAAGPELTTDAAGEVVEDRRTEPFGAAIDTYNAGSTHAVDYHANPINALNKFTDPDTGWSFHGARWLAPDTAQWHSPDPIAVAPDAGLMSAPWQLGPYQYVTQNPVLFWDPDGRSGAVGALLDGFEKVVAEVEATPEVGVLLAEAQTVVAVAGISLVVASVMQSNYVDYGIVPSTDPTQAAWFTLAQHTWASPIDKAQSLAQSRAKAISQVRAVAQANAKAQQKDGPKPYRMRVQIQQGPLHLSSEAIARDRPITAQEVNDAFDRIESQVPSGYRRYQSELHQAVLQMREKTLNFVRAGGTDMKQNVARVEFDAGKNRKERIRLDLENLAGKNLQSAQ